jgi:hypothetical protein
MESGEKGVVPCPPGIVACAVYQLHQPVHLIDCRRPRAVGWFGAAMNALHADAQSVIQGQIHASIPLSLALAPDIEGTLPIVNLDQGGSLRSAFECAGKAQ